MPEPDVQLGTKTVVELDLVGFSDRARLLEDELGAEIVFVFQEQIQRFVSVGLLAAGVEPGDTVLAETGDGALLLFADAAAAHHFAQGVHDACSEHNAGRASRDAERWFRIGAATGDVAERERDGKKEVAGTAIARAVRFETAGTPGHFLVDAATYEALPPELRELYGPEEEVPGKREERFRGRRCVMTEVDVDAAEPPAPATRLEVMQQLNALRAADLCQVIAALEAGPYVPATVSSREKIAALAENVEVAEIVEAMGKLGLG